MGEPVTRHCAYQKCGAEFTTKHPQRRFCSPACCKRSWKVNLKTDHHHTHIVRALLGQGYSLRDIGRQIERSYEWVRQIKIANGLGEVAKLGRSLLVRTRQVERALAQSPRKSLVDEFVAVAKQRGLQVSIERKGTKGALTVLVEGSQVKFHRARVVVAPNGIQHEGYLRLSYRTPQMFHAIALPDGGWRFILPSATVPRPLLHVRFDGQDSKMTNRTVPVHITDKPTAQEIRMAQRAAQWWVDGLGGRNDDRRVG